MGPACIRCTASPRCISAPIACWSGGTCGLRFAFNTNGAANHRLDDALTLIAEAGYDGVALTLDIHHLDPFDPDFLLGEHPPSWRPGCGR